MSLALYIIIMVTSTINFLAYIPSRSQVTKFSLQLQSESVQRLVNAGGLFFFFAMNLWKFEFYIMTVVLFQGQK